MPPKEPYRLAQTKYLIDLLKSEVPLGRTRDQALQSMVSPARRRKIPLSPEACLDLVDRRADELAFRRPVECCERVWEIRNKGDDYYEPYSHLAILGWWIYEERRRCLETDLPGNAASILVAGDEEKFVLIISGNAPPPVSHLLWDVRLYEEPISKSAPVTDYLKWIAGARNALQDHHASWARCLESHFETSWKAWGEWPAEDRQRWEPFLQQVLPHTFDVWESRYYTPENEQQRRARANGRRPHPTEKHRIKTLRFLSLQDGPVVNSVLQKHLDVSKNTVKALVAKLILDRVVSRLTEKSGIAITPGGRMELDRFDLSKREGPK